MRTIGDVGRAAMLAATGCARSTTTEPAPTATYQRCGQIGEGLLVDRSAGALGGTLYALSKPSEAKRCKVVW